MDTALEQMRCCSQGGYLQAQGEYKVRAHIAALEAELAAAKAHEVRELETLAVVKNAQIGALKDVVFAARVLILAADGPQGREIHALADALARLE